MTFFLGWPLSAGTFQTFLGVCDPLISPGLCWWGWAHLQRDKEPNRIPARKVCVVAGVPNKFTATSAMSREGGNSVPGAPLWGKKKFGVPINFIPKALKLGFSNAQENQIQESVRLTECTKRSFDLEKVDFCSFCLKMVLFVLIFPKIRFLVL